jgi:hypothetical protein
VIDVHISVIELIRRNQWHAALLTEDEPLNSRYPMKAPTATASMIQPLYVMNKSLAHVS